jgi:hypothetical protein
MENMKQVFQEEVEWISDPVTAAAGADAVALLTDWPQYSTLPFRKIAATMNRPDHLRRPQLPPPRRDARNRLPVLPHGPPLRSRGPGKRGAGSLSPGCNKYSARITQPASIQPGRLAGHALRHGDDPGRHAEAAGRHLLAMWYEGNTCNMHLNDLAAKVRRACWQAGHGGMRFNTIGVSDGISMGTDGHELLAAVARPHRRQHRNRSWAPSGTTP